MYKWVAFFMVSSVFSAVYAADEKEIQKVYPYWVQNAALIYVYNHKGTLAMSVPITHGATMFDIRQYLIDEYVTNHNSRYDLSPLYNEWWRFGRWYYADVRLSPGKIKDHMERYNTRSFWINRKKPAEVCTSEDSE